MCRRSARSLIVLVLALPALARAERLPVKAYTTADGLANNIVNRIVRDSRGFLWFCTREGLSRFDGYGFTTYGIEHGLPSAVVNDLLETHDGIYWIATSKGLARFDPLGSAIESSRNQQRMFTTYIPDTDARTHHVTSLLEDRAGNVWLGTWAGLYRFQSDGTGRINPASGNIATLEINCLMEDASGVLWAGASGGIYRLGPGQGIERYTVGEAFPQRDIQSLLADREGRIWVGSRSRGLGWLALDPHSHRPVVGGVYTTRDGLPANWINHILQRSDGSLWAGTAAGLVQLLPANGGYRFRTYTEAHGLTSSQVISAAEDRHRNLWIGTNLGATKILPGELTIFGKADGLPSAASLFQSGTGDLMVMDGGGRVWCVNRFDGQKFVATRLPLSRGEASWGWNQMFLVDRAGHWWIGTRAGVLRFHNVTSVEQLARAAPSARYTRRQGLAADVVIRLFEDSHGDVWIGTVGEGRPNGLSRWERTTGAFHHYVERDGLPPLDRFFVSSFAEDREGGLWIGFSGDGGLVRHRDGRITRFAADAGVPPGSIRNLLIDSRGGLWAPSYGGGLVRVEAPAADRPAFTSYTTAQGLSSNEVGAVVEDSAGRIYAGTARGLDRLDLATGSIKSYRAGNGLLLGHVQAALRDRTGALWFSYNSGLVRLVPASDAPSVAPSILITAVHVAGQGRAVSALGQTDLSYFELPAGRNPLQIDFVSPGSGPAEGLGYQLKLEGADESWSRPADHRSVTYANLAPGAYRFLVRAVNADGVLSSTTAGFSFTIVSPIWQRWWVMSLAALICAAAGHALYRYRVSRLLEVATMRARIATDLHDDIGANLTRIAVLSEVVRRHNRDGAAPVDGHLASIATVARESVTAMSDIVWAISPDRDSLHELARKMREHAEEVFAAGDIRLAFDLPDAARDARLGVNMRRDIYLIFKEAVNNAARHAGCSRVDVELRFDSARLTLTVTDDGTGFDPDAGSDGNGLLNMRRRAERLAGTLGIVSGPGGTTVRLEVPFRKTRQPGHPASIGR